MEEWRFFRCFWLSEWDSEGQKGAAASPPWSWRMLSDPLRTAVAVEDVARCCAFAMANDSTKSWVKEDTEEEEEEEEEEDTEDTRVPPREWHGCRFPCRFSFFFFFFFFFWFGAGLPFRLPSSASSSSSAASSFFFWLTVDEEVHFCSLWVRCVAGRLASSEWVKTRLPFSPAALSLQR